MGRSRKQDRGLLALERQATSRRARAVGRIPDLPAVRQVKTGASFRWLWPEGYQPEERDGREYVLAPLTCGKYIKLPHYLKTKGRTDQRTGLRYSLVSSKVSKTTGVSGHTRALQWLTRNSFRLVD
jgi:hypothetical protein